jgi:hypothetical protein
MRHWPPWSFRVPFWHRPFARRSSRFAAYSSHSWRIHYAVGCGLAVFGDRDGRSQGRPRLYSHAGLALFVSVGDGSTHGRASAPLDHNHRERQQRLRRRRNHYPRHHPTPQQQQQQPHTGSIARFTIPQEQQSLLPHLSLSSLPSYGHAPQQSQSYTARSQQPQPQQLTSYTRSCGAHVGRVGWTTARATNRRWRWQRRQQWTGQHGRIGKADFQKLLRTPHARLGRCAECRPWKSFSSICQRHAKTNRSRISHRWICFGSLTTPRSSGCRSCLERHSLCANCTTASSTVRGSFRVRTCKLPRDRCSYAPASAGPSGSCAICKRRSSANKISSGSSFCGTFCSRLSGTSCPIRRHRIWRVDTPLSRRFQWKKNRSKYRQRTRTCASVAKVNATICAS